MSKDVNFIIIDGTDGAGKTTVAKTVQSLLDNRKIKSFIFHFPNYESPTGKVVNEYLQGTLYTKESIPSIYVNSILYTTDRMVNFSNYMSFFREFDVIILDRSYISNLLLQTVDLNEDEVIKYIKMFYPFEIEGCGLTPKRVCPFVLYHEKFETGLELIHKRGTTDIHESNIEYLKKVQNNVLRLPDIISKIEDPNIKRCYKYKLIKTSNKDGVIINSIDIANSIISGSVNY